MAGRLRAPLVGSNIGWITEWRVYRGGVYSLCRSSNDSGSLLVMQQVDITMTLIHFYDGGKCIGGHWGGVHKRITCLPATSCVRNTGLRMLRKHCDGAVCGGESIYCYSCVT